MRASRGRLQTALAFATLAISACSAAAPAPADRPSGLSAAEIDSIYRERTESARTRFTEADVRFMTGMIHHHAQAIEVARLVPSRDVSRQIEVLAARIINAQRDEIATMQGWLRDRGLPVPEVDATDEGVTVHGGAMGHDVHMPGMLADEQIRELKSAQGREFERLFLNLMIQHHNGAVTMVRELFATDGAAQDEDVFRFASDVQVDQATEIARMERMLAALEGGDLTS